jgi:hypothetical protein
MFVVVHHRVVDRKKFLATDPQDIGGNALSGVQVRRLLPARNTSAAACPWETESLVTPRDCLDPATRGICVNTYFEVDPELAMGLPQTTSANV